MSERNGIEVAKGIVQSLSDPAVLLDKDFNFIACSAAYPQLVGMRRRQLRQAIESGITSFELVGGDPKYSQATAQTCMETKKAMHFAEEQICNQAGQEITVILSYLPVLGLDGQVVGVIQSFRDVSAEARLQGRYRKLLGQERLRAENLEREVEKRTSELSSALEEVTRLSRMDPLTGLLNRRAFTELAQQAMKLAKRHNRSMGLLLGDIDFFKKINDQYGHMIGDKILAATASAMSKAVRDSDPVARFGGEEFVILLTETDRESVSIVGERVRRYVSEIENTSDEQSWPQPTLSLGMSVFPDHGSTLDELISNADKALYRAKESGRNRSVMYELGGFGQEAQKVSSRLPTILLVGDARFKGFSGELSESYAMTVADHQEALKLCEKRSFDVLLSDLDSAEEGAEFLRRSQRYSPESLRVLVIDSQEIFVEIRGGNLARVDSFLLRSEAVEHIASAIDDGLARREQDRQRVMLKSDGMRKLLANRLDELDKLVAEKAIDFVYQPIVDPRTQEIFAYEALCRARHPIFKNPQVLFDAAVQSGCLWELGRVTRELSSAALSRMPPGVKLFLNLHPGEIDDPQLAEFGDTELGKRVVFEITERTSIPDYTRFRAITQKLGEKGFEFAIDDLGAGYAGLNAVALLSPEFVKVDMAMVRGIDQAPRRKKLLQRIVDFANDVGIRLIAEGIETPQEAQAVAEIGCHLCQGYYFGKPSTRITDKS